MGAVITTVVVNKRMLLMLFKICCRRTFDTTLSCNEFRKVWIAWGPPGVRLGVGGKADNNTLLTTTYGASLTVHHIWISMYETASGDWRVGKEHFHNESSLWTPGIGLPLHTSSPEIGNRHRLNAKRRQKSISWPQGFALATITASLLPESLLVHDDSQYIILYVHYAKMTIILQ